jgi:hypothetical protein
MINKRLLIALSLLAPPAAFGATPDRQPSYDELLKRLDALQAKVDRLEANQRNYDAQVQDTVRRVHDDAERRSRLIDPDTTLTAAYKDGRLLIQTPDGNYLFHPYAQFQFREVGTYRQDVNAAGDDDWQNGFEVRRMRFGIDGNVFSPDLTYAFQWLYDRNGGNPFLEDAWARYRLLPQWSVTAGQFKDPLTHESILSSKYLLTLERSLVNELFSPGDNYIQGASVTWDNLDNVRVTGAFHDGANTYPGVNGFNNDFEDFPNPNGSRFAGDFGGAGRVEYKAFGDWSDYNTFVALGLKKPLLVFGAAADVTQAGGTTVYTQTADAQYKARGGWTFYAAGYTHEVQDSPVSPSAGATYSVFDWGALAQVGYLFAPKWEAYGRYDFIGLGPHSALLGTNTQQYVQEISVGVNYYIHNQSAKLTLDLTYLPEGSPAGDPGAGILPDDGHNEFVISGQLQLLL